jgi:16S rRNA A1518/A1519 N6-dimethyltransferase RsmA/KsgA/DIM1 with predicted DNA glycosylase/AP lyase activity
MEAWKRALVAGVGTAALTAYLLWVYSKVAGVEIPRALYPVYVIPVSVAAAAVAAVR